jgi:hypothetical protein
MADEDHIRQAAHATGEHIAEHMRRSVGSMPADQDLADHIQVWHSRDNVHVGVPPSHEEHDRMQAVEWGSIDRSPTGVLRRSLRDHVDSAQEVFYRHLRKLI